MSAPKKLQQEGELPKLKKLWPTLHESVQEYWREQFSSQRSQVDLRSELLKKLNVNLRFDVQLTRFRAWLDDQDKRDRQAERAEENQRRLIAEHPDWTLERVREEVLKQSYFETLASGDFKLGLKTVKAHQNQEVIGMDERRLKLMEKKAAAFDEAKGILGNKELSEEEKKTRMQQLFGI